MKVSKNIAKGDRITGFDYLMTLARQKKSVVVYVGGNYFVRPAAFLVNWSLSQLAHMQIYHAVKIENHEA